jgi:hypothetical protein
MASRADNEADSISPDCVGKAMIAEVGITCQLI